MANHADETPSVEVYGDGVKLRDVKDYAISDDVLQLSDACSFTVPNVDGEMVGKVRLGGLLEFYMSDPAVGGGKKIRRLKGRVIGLDYSSDISGGSVLRVDGADLGWHLTHTCGPLFKSLRGIRFKAMLEKYLDPSWGFAAEVRSDNDLDHRLKQGRTGIDIANQQATSPGSVIPRIQFEPGQTVADAFILYAKRERVLVNVASDGVLQFFRPRSTGDVDYSVRYYGSDKAARQRNNVKDRPHLTMTLDGLYSKVTCVSAKVVPLKTIEPDKPGGKAPSNVSDFTNPNEHFNRRDWQVPNPPPFSRFHSFTDSEQLGASQVQRRAKWKAERGEFDSWVYEVQMFGHSQNGRMFTSDSLVDVDDTVNGVKGIYYVAGVKLARSLREGTYSTLTIRKKGLLAA